MKLIYGTNNPSKITYMKRRLTDIDIELVGLNALGEALIEPEESGNNPTDNAIMKALGYYKQLKRPVLSADSGLYFEGVSEEDQPGVHIKRINGLDMGYEDMLHFYSNLARKYGGKLLARYHNAMCLVVDEKSVFLLEGDDIASEPFYIVDTPHEKYAEGFPLDSISVDVKTMKYFYDMDEIDDMFENTRFDEAVRGFIKEHMNKL